MTMDAASITTTTPPQIHRRYCHHHRPVHNNAMPMAAGAVSIHLSEARTNPSSSAIILHAVPQKDTQEGSDPISTTTYPELGTDL